MMCVRSMSFSVLINGEPKGLIQPSKGFHQGDSLSPYLFLLYTEGLISLIYQAMEKKLLTGIRICRRAPSMTHLLFTDDSVLFFKANMVENRMIINS